MSWADEMDSEDEPDTHENKEILQRVGMVKVSVDLQGSSNTGGKEPGDTYSPRWIPAKCWANSFAGVLAGCRWPAASFAIASTNDGALVTMMW